MQSIYRLPYVGVDVNMAQVRMETWLLQVGLMRSVGGVFGSEEAQRVPCFVFVIIIIIFIVVFIVSIIVSSIIVVVVMPIAVTSGMVVRTGLTFLLDGGIHYSCLSSRFLDTGKLCEPKSGLLMGFDC